MVASLELTRQGVPIAGFLGLSSTSDYDRWKDSPERVLGPRELATYAPLAFPLRRTSYLLGRLAVKRALSALFSEPRSERLEVLPGVFGQPLLCPPSPGLAEVSLAHARGLAVGVACAAGHPVGIDLEPVEPARQDLLAKTFPRDQFKLFTALGTSEITAGFLLWTMGEALGKVLHCGLTVPFEILGLHSVVRIESGAGSEGYFARFLHFTQYAAHAWVIGAYALTLVTPRLTGLNFRPSSEFSSHFATDSV